MRNWSSGKSRTNKKSFNCRKKSEKSIQFTLELLRTYWGLPLFLLLTLPANRPSRMLRTTTTFTSLNSTTASLNRPSTKRLISITECCRASRSKFAPCKKKSDWQRRRLKGAGNPCSSEPVILRRKPLRRHISRLKRRKVSERNLRKPLTKNIEP